jgi:hypothetical protein
MNKACPLLIAVSCLTASLLQAQSALVMVNPPPGSQWSVEITQPKEPVAKEDSESLRKPALPIRMERIVGKNGYQQGQIDFSDGSKNLFYVVGNHLLQKYDNSEEIAVFGIPPNDLENGIYDSLRVASFPATAWINEKNFVGMDKLGEVECKKHHLSAETAGQDLTAWIRASDLYPLRVQVGGVTYNFSPINPFGGDVILPANFQKAITRLLAEERALKAMQPRK